MNTIQASELRDAVARGRVRLIDVRTPAEFREAHVRGAVNVPLDRLSAADVPAGDGPLYVVCQKGGRGQKACEKLLAAGLADVVNVEGGTLACIEAGVAVERGKKTISLERQVRIAAGSLVVSGVALGWWVHPGFFGLAAFVGAGLVFAGVTDTCGMGMLLARMPWNQAGGCCGANGGAGRASCAG